MPRAVAPAPPKLCVLLSLFVSVQNVHTHTRPPTMGTLDLEVLAPRESNCTTDTQVVTKLLDSQIYSKHKAPSSSAVLVRVEFWIQQIISVSEITNDFELDMYINELWDDPNLSFKHLNSCKDNMTMSQSCFRKIWTPNSCFVNSKKALIHDSPSESVFLTLFSNGSVWTNYRLRVKGPCTMDLAKFPMDEQSCSLIYESYNIDQVRMQWNSARRNPVYSLAPIQLPDFDIKKIEPKRIMVKYPAGNWDELVVTFTFRRRYVWYFLQCFVPTYLTIFISWVAFSLGPNAIPARTMLGVNALLAMIFQFGSIMRSLPRVSYIKAIDVWILVSMTFIFLSLMELALVGHFLKQEESTSRQSIQSFKIRKSEQIDQYAKLIFPAGYSIFNILYWWYYVWSE
ncbi:hypothetical protein QR680_002780 [Steinernema hermaphroditum]|uniref:Neurotransmitter-gated ion-channel ligand-binding domain-containing protein n=1 Tax=Steinernema hermaphroditum TaxID=289476 RepID=A0AA39LIS7_9BILA|nr:hypothetical protein QR680_002780 [Steinernema hermaphroditum]